MKSSDFKEQFPKEYTEYHRQEFLNPLRVFEEYYFYNKDHDYQNGAANENYRGKAIARCINERLNFTSTHNSIYELMKQLVQVKCPNCGELLIGAHGGGNSSEYWIRYECKVCGITASISTPPEGLGITFK